MHRRIKKQVHISWFIACLSSGFLVGVALSALPWSSTFTDVSWLVIGAVLFIVAALKRKALLIIFALASGLLFGLWRGASELHALTAYQPFYGKNITVSGKITEDTSFGPQGDQRLRLGNIKISNQELPEEIWISTTSTLDIKRGDVVTIKGTLIKGFGNIPASRFRATLIKTERPDPGDIGRRIRDRFAESVKASIPEPEASLGVGYLVGQRSALPESLDQQIKTVGLTHAIVASGYNLTILVSFACGLFAKKSKYLAVLASITMIGGFLLITGFSPSMSRASLVAGLSLAAWYYGRKIHPFVLLPFAAAVTALLHPAYIWGDIGWYLSFSAFIGVIVLAPLVHHYFWGANKKPHAIRALIVETVSAQLATLPIILLVFHQYSQYALLANILVVPLVPILMACTFYAGLAGLFMPGIAWLVSVPAVISLSYSARVISFVANLPNAKTEVTFSPYMLVLSYIFIVITIGHLWNKTRHSFRKDNMHAL
jgi:competence protein ComEC